MRFSANYNIHFSMYFIKILISYIDYYYDIFMFFFFFCCFCSLTVSAPADISLNEKHQKGDFAKPLLLCST